MAFFFIFEINFKGFYLRKTNQIICTYKQNNPKILLTVL